LPSLQGKPQGHGSVEQFLNAIVPAEGIIPIAKHPEEIAG
jgi:hypothetical protein